MLFLKSKNRFILNIIQQRSEFILNSFIKDQTWEERYRRIIKWGDRMIPLESSLKEDKLLVKGCQSRVWLLAEKQNGRTLFKGDSDALITKGLLSLMIYFYSGLTNQEILKNRPEFVEKLDLLNHLTPSRSSGLGSLIRYIQNYAKAFLIIEKAQIPSI